MGEENTPIYRRVKYEDWIRMIEETIFDSYRLLQYYIDMYNNAERIANLYNLSGLVDLIKKHYEEKIANQLENLLNNIDMYNMGIMYKDNAEFYIDITDRSPVLIYVPKTMKKYLKFNSIEHV